MSLIISRCFGFTGVPFGPMGRLVINCMQITAAKALRHVTFQIARVELYLASLCCLLRVLLGVMSQLGPTGLADLRSRSRATAQPCLSPTGMVAAPYLNGQRLS